MNAKIALPTLWQIPDDLWQRIRRLLPAQKPRHSPGRPRLNYRQVLNGIVYVLRTGCQWKAVPSSYGSGSSIHRYFQTWVEYGIFLKIWQLLLRRYDHQCHIGWDWQSVDGTMLKAPLGGTGCGPNPTDRRKSGTKRHLLVDRLVDRRGVPLSIVIDGAHRPDMRLLDQTLSEIVVNRPSTGRAARQHLCLDKGYDYADCERVVAKHGYIAHISRTKRSRKGRAAAAAAGTNRKHPARRWVVERTHSWYNRFGKLLVRYEKSARNYFGLIALASALIIYRIIYRVDPRARPYRVLG